MVLSPRRLRSILERLATMDHVKIVRFHTRVPVADPARVTRNWSTPYKPAAKTTYVAIHANHPRELTADARTVIKQLHAAGIALVSQTVLLKGVNDDAGILAELMRTFVELRIGLTTCIIPILHQAPATSG